MTSTKEWYNRYSYHVRETRDRKNGPVYLELMVAEVLRVGIGLSVSGGVVLEVQGCRYWRQVWQWRDEFCVVLALFPRLLYLFFYAAKAFLH